MNDAAFILVIILSSFLALFLLLSIILVGLMISIAKKVNAITSSVEHTTKQFENVASTVSKVASPAIIAKYVLKTLSKRESKK